MSLGTREGTSDRTSTGLGGYQTPLLRGRFHVVAAFISMPAGIHVVEQAESSARLGVSIYALSWTAMFTASSLLHRVSCSPSWKRRLRRADHSMIFVHIAGAATPLALLALPPLLAVGLLVAVWGGAALGVATKVCRLTAESANGSWLYRPLGWTVGLCLPLMVPGLGATNTMLLCGTGLAYSVGARCYFQRRPDPLPSVFGFHEIWHLLTIVGGFCHYLVVLDVASR